MCLNTITKRHDPPLGERWAWKVFVVGPLGELHGNYFGRPERPRGRWLLADGMELFAEDDTPYRAGFHAFPLRADAEKWRAGETGPMVIVRVKIREIRTEGKQLSSKGKMTCLVADQMLIPWKRKATIRKRKSR